MKITNKKKNIIEIFNKNADYLHEGTKKLKMSDLSKKRYALFLNLDDEEIFGNIFRTAKRADYIFSPISGHNFVIEKKIIEHDKEEELEKKLKEEEDFPLIFGTVPAQPVLNNMKNGKTLKQNYDKVLFNKIGGYMRKANRQTKSTAERFKKYEKDKSSALLGSEPYQ